MKNEILAKIKNITNNSYTCNEIASILGVDVSTARNIAKKNKLAVKIGGKIYVLKERFYDYLENEIKNIKKGE